MSRLRFSTIPGLRQTATAHLAQTMTLLALGGDELDENVRAELDNPALEVVDDHRCRACGRPVQRPGHCAVCADQGLSDDPIVFLSPRGWSFGGETPEEQGDREALLATPEKLPEHLLRQIGPELTLEERPIAAHLIFSLDEDGLLREHPAELADRLGKPLSLVRRVLDLLQRSDPPGVGAATPLECLLIQTEVLRSLGDKPVPPLAEPIISSHFKLLGRHEYGQIARLMGVHRSEVEQAALFIRRNLTPYPARAFSGDRRWGASTPNERYYNPDVTIALHPSGHSGPLVVEVSTPTSGWLKVSPEFREALRSCPDSERDEWDRHYQRAVLFAKCLQQRNNTMRRLLDVIAKTQRKFILHGDRHLTPMTRNWVSVQLGVHESTISRAVAGKTVALPGGRIVPMEKFFDRSLSVREIIKDLIAAECPTKPLTDEAIVAGLVQKNIRIARRTVAKYRAAEGILPAAMRSRMSPGRVNPPLSDSGPLAAQVIS